MSMYGSELINELNNRRPKKKTLEQWIIATALIYFFFLRRNRGTRGEWEGGTFFWEIQYHYCHRIKNIFFLIFRFIPTMRNGNL